MGQERRLQGYTASPGYAAGAIFRLSDTAPDETTEQGTPAEERERLLSALSMAGADLFALAETLEDEDAAGIVEFQAAMLEDDSLYEPALEAIAGGAPAAAAWRAAMQQQIDDYLASDDSYFNARASDLTDMRDRVLRTLFGAVEEKIPPGSILVADDLSPTRFLTSDWTRSGIALYGASPTAHVAILARARGVPMIVGLSRPDAAPDGPALLDAARGVLVLSPSAETRQGFDTDRRSAASRAEEDARFAAKAAVTAAGQSVPVYINVADPEELEVVDVRHCDGIGLVRTEFLFQNGAAPPDEEAQYGVYRRLVDWAQGRPVTLRTLDAGGDKPIAGITVDGESNPFLGVRGVRLSLKDPAFFKVQLRAMVRAAAHGPVKIMVPMVTAPEEMAQARGLLDDAVHEVTAVGRSAGEVQLGMMVEVPAAALTIEDFDCDFYSIGSNDLVQYATACGRDVPGLNHLTAPDGKAVLRLIKMVAAVGAASGREVSVCGDMAGDARFTDALLDSGVAALSMAPNAVAAVKGAVSRHGRSAA